MRHKPMPKARKTVDPFTREVYNPEPGPVLRPGAMDYKACPSKGMGQEPDRGPATPGKWRAR